MTGPEESTRGTSPILPTLSRVSVIICALNEETCLPHVLPRIPGFVSEVILVDGHSKDRTVEVARELRPDIKVYTQPGRGKGAALRHGFKHATGDIIVTLDADGSTDPQDIEHFVRPLLAGAHFVKGSRFLNTSPSGMPLHRILGNRLLAIVANALFGTKFTDICSGYNAFWRSLLQEVDLLSGRDSDVESAIYLRLARAGKNVVEVTHRDGGRIAGQSKMASIREGANNVKIMLRERFARSREASASGRDDWAAGGRR